MRDPLIISYLIACGHSPAKARQHYHTFAMQIGIEKRAPNWKHTTPTPKTADLPHTMSAIRKLNNKPRAVTKDEYDKAKNSIRYWEQFVASATKRRYPNTYRVERRKATRALHHALAYRDALALMLNEIEPGSVPSPNHKPHAKRAPGVSVKLASWRYALRNRTMQEAELCIVDEAAKLAYEEAAQDRDQAAAQAYLMRMEVDAALDKRRAKNSDARSARGTGKATRALKAAVHQTRAKAKATQATYTMTRAQLAKCRRQIAELKNKVRIINQTD